MDIPDHDEDHTPRIRNIHPSQLTPDYGAVFGDPIERTASTFSERIGDFAGSYSRTSMMFMAENLTVPSVEDEEDKYSGYYTSISRVPSGVSSRLSRYETGNGSTSEPTVPLLSQLDKVLSMASLKTVADDDRFEAPVVNKKSSFTQSIFNSINILIGIGILALPLGFKCAGWAVGITVFVFCCGLTNYTAKLLQQCLDLDPDSRTYGDMGALAFGFKGRLWVTILFITELITSSVALVVLLGDGIDSLFPGYDLPTIRVISFFLLTPMLFLPVRHLSYTSLLGIISAFSIICVIVYDGLDKKTAPGSLIEPADTEWLPSDYSTVPLSFGLIMAGFAGHAVFPTVYRDMETPKHYVKMVNWTYVATTFVYFGVASCGYIMFGSKTMQEITQNLVMVPEYNQTLNRLAVWLIAMNPIAKYGLTVNPINISWQLWLFSGKDHHHHHHIKSAWREQAMTVLGKLIISACIVLLAYVIPGFDKVMSLLGAFFSFMISGIFPLVCHVRLFGETMSTRQKLLDYTLIFIASCMALIGTLWSFL
ncbi:transmembrane amino acid transporter protein-domain-containing protein [Sporodiniella umbellata]|nr:transmembrane amino acid transporter protein-domain-containing protein [Sporodiniella umbellata]